MSLTGHEANANLLWVSGKLWESLTAEQKGWVEAAANEVATKEPALAVALEAKSRAKLQKLGVKFVTDVDKSGFIKVAEPLQDKIAARPWPACGEDPGNLPNRSSRWPAPLVLEADRHLKWRALDAS